MWNFKRYGPLALMALGFAVLSAVAVAIVFLVHDQGRLRTAVQSAFDIQSRLERVLSDLLDAETGQRGYLLTGEDRYLAPYERAVSSLDGDLEDLAGALAAEPAQRQTLIALRKNAAEKMAELRQTVGLRRDGQMNAAIAIVLSDKGKDLMDRVRQTISMMTSEESRLLLARQDEARQKALAVQYGAFAALALSLLMSALVFRSMRRQFASIAQAYQTLNETHTALASANNQLVKEVAAREHVEAQLRQAQKLEAVGQLAGGLAHDFNNMLAVVIGSITLLKRRIARGDPDVGKFADAALDGADRSKILVHRLLAFSRQQPLAPQPLEVNKLVSNMSQLLRQTLGEQISIETILAGGLWRTRADANQLESVILNLAVNARDAMPDGGRLTIETANASLDDDYAARHAEVTAGQYVLLIMTDTGSGMTPDVIAKAFDPFFTTKKVGKGTGLGLSQVYGFVKQSGGQVKIYSEPGQGTSVKVYLPRLLTGASEEVMRDPVDSGDLPWGSPDVVILVVEDDEGARRVSAETLRELGYTVVHAQDGVAALRVLEARRDITLLFTDVVMPEMNGRQLAEQACKMQPNLKVLYTTGFSRNAVIHNGVLDAGVNFLAKPFTMEQLARKVRQVLAEKITN